jgi:hypothetical protein
MARRPCHGDDRRSRNDGDGARQDIACKKSRAEKLATSGPFRRKSAAARPYAKLERLACRRRQNAGHACLDV